MATRSGNRYNQVVIENVRVTTTAENGSATPQGPSGDRLPRENLSLVPRGLTGYRSHTLYANEIPQLSMIDVKVGPDTKKI